MKKKRPYFSVIIPVRNEEARIGACLESIMNQQTRKSYEVIVVDGHSTDNTRSIVKKFPLVKLITQIKPGKCEAYQQGYKLAKGTLLCFTEADCLAPRHWLSAIESAMQSSAKPIAVTGIYTYIENDWVYNTLLWLYMPIVINIFRFIWKNHTIRTTNVAIRKYIMDRVGGFDTKTQELYDTDLGLRISRYGPIAFVPAMNNQTSNRRIKGRLLQYLREACISFYYIGLLRRPVPKPIYADIR